MERAASDRVFVGKDLSVMLDKPITQPNFITIEDKSNHVFIQLPEWVELKQCIDKLVYGELHEGEPHENEVWISVLDYNIRAAIRSVDDDTVRYEINGLGELQLSKDDFLKAYRPDYIDG